MQGLPFVLLFTALTFLSWGAYGPLLRYGTSAMGHDGLKAFVGVGLAYFLIAVVVPFWILRNKGEKGRWTLVGTTYSIIAGSVGAIGALGIILALVFKGDPVFVMPLVFGFAPIVNTLVTAWMGGTLNKIRPVFVGGILAAALGASGVLYFKPSGKSSAVLAKAAEPAELTTPDVDQPVIEKDAAIAPGESAKNLQPEPRVETKAPDVEPKNSPSPVPVAPSAPLVAALPAEGLPPVPVKPSVATLPDNGQPPVPEIQPSAASPSIIASLPDADGQPPKPEPLTTDSTKADVPKSSASNDDRALPPPVVNPEADLGDLSAEPKSEPKSDKKAAEPASAPVNEPSQQPAQVKPSVELPPPVPNPEADLSQRAAQRLWLVTTVASADETTESIDAADVKAVDAHKDASASAPNIGMIALSILMAALCWGSYGPMLHQGQMKMGGSRLRPFACVGIAYFIIAVAVPLVLLYTTPSISHGQWNVKGMFWSIIAGGAGALGALGIILAFNAGGKPIYVMPLVFGFAPVINTFISLTEAGAWSRVEVWFWASLGVVIAGAITVLTTAPKAAHGPAHAAPSK